jgi:hypothetical protein
MRAILESHCFHVFSILLLLLCSFSSAFVPLSLPMRTPRAVRLQVMTEPPRGGTSRTEAKEDKDDDPKALSPESDYLLQTEDFTRQWKKPEQHSLEVPRVRHTVLSERDYHRLEAIIFQDDATEGSEEATVLQRRVSLPNIPIPPRLARPGVAWQHHHHATVNLVRQHRNQKHDGPIQFITNIINRPQLVSTCSEWKRLEKHAEYIGTTHLKDLLQDRERCDEMYATHDGVYLDYSRQRVTLETMKFLYALAEKQNLKGQIDKMVKGDKINFTEDRAVLHTALRAERALTGTVMVDGVDVIAEVHQVLDQVKVFTDGVRSGQIRGYTGKRLRNIVSVGIGGLYLGLEFLHECLKAEPEGSILHWCICCDSYFKRRGSGRC